MEKKKRERSINFSRSETDLLVDLVIKYKNIIENKKSDAVMWRHKEKVWLKLTNEFNASRGYARSMKTLKLKYETIKKNLKKKFSINRGSSDECPPNEKFTKSEEKLLGMVSLTLDGLKSQYDNSNLIASEIVQTEIGNSSDDQIDDIKPQFYEEMPQPSSTEVNKIGIPEDFSENDSEDWQHWSSSYQKPLKFRRNSISDFNGLSELKRELVQLQIESVKYDIKTKRELHNLKLKSLNLDIQLKEAELILKKKHLHLDEDTK